ARHFGDIESLASASEENLLEVRDIGEVITKSVHDYFSDPGHLEEIRRLKEAGLRFSVEEAAASSSALSGMTIVVSGNFSKSRDEIKRLIESNGGKNSSSVSGKTSFLLAGSKPGPEKIRKAEELGVRIISEDEFMGMITSVENVSGDDGIVEPTLF
ncbi:MAG: NAD-dependent DNA ligase LigA, partial [Bacteroidales bacterium]|nr:NAD-dependent DNA ligase LigA [Bacteroidales bacterium]